MAHFVLGHFVAAQPGGRRLRKQRERMLRAIRPARRNEIFYRRQLGLIVHQLRLATEVITEELRPHWPVPRAADSAADSVAPGGFGGYMGRAFATFGDIEAVALRLTDVRNRLSLIRRNLAAVDANLIAAVRQSVSVDISGALNDGGRIQAEMQRAARQNAELITSIPTEHLERVRLAVEKAFTEGTRWEVMARELREIGNITDRRARLIARDQTASMNSAFNRVRQTELGIKEYLWSGSLDARERDSHRRMEGVRCSWASPPSVDGESVNPGEPIMCRCVAQPIIEVLHLSVVAEAEAEAVAA